MKSLLAGRVSSGEMYFRPHDGSLLFILNASTEKVDRSPGKSVIRLTYQLLARRARTTIPSDTLVMPRSDITICSCYADTSPFPAGFVLISGRPGVVY